MSRKHKWDKEYLKSFLESKRLITEMGCWEWTGFKDRDGYGKITIQGKQYYVHRVMAWICKDFDLESKLETAHTCDNPPCCNPEHLIEMTHEQNMQSSIDKKRSGWQKR